MQHFYIPCLNISRNKIILCDKEKIHHLIDVLRFKPQERLAVFDCQGQAYVCAIAEIMPHQLILQIEKKLLQNKGIPGISIACAIPKRAKMDEIIDKLTQLAVERIIPMKSSRVVVRWDKEREQKRQARWQKIVESALQQSQQASLTEVQAITAFKEVVLHAQEYDLKLIPALIGERRKIKEVLPARPPKKIIALIGPEGDFTPQEVAWAKKAGFIPVSLGESVLRVDTACISVASFIRLYYAQH